MDFKPTEADIKLWSKEADYARKLYKKSLAENKVSYQSVRWGSESSQYKRFEVLASLSGILNSSVIDVGSGLGDFYLYLREHGFSGKYVGYDITEEMIQQARERFLEVEFNQEHVLSLNQQHLTSADYVCASGIFTYCKHEPYKYLYAVVAKMYSIAKKGVAFNCLSSWGEEPEQGECQFEPDKVLLMLKNISKNIIVRHEYLPHDFTVILYRS